MLPIRYAILALFICSTAQAADISQDYRYQVLIDEPTELNVPYKTAFYYTKEEWADLKQADVDARIETEVANYVSIVKNPPSPYEPSKEELQEAKAQLEAQIVELDAKIVTAKPKVKNILAEEIIA